MGVKSLFRKTLSVFHRLFDIIIHFMFRVACSGNSEELPPIKNLLLLSSATSLATKIRNKKLKSVDLVNAYTSRIKEVNPFINAIVSDRYDAALQEAQDIDELIASNLKTVEELERETPFLGVPFSTKELISVEGMPFSGGLVSRKSIRSTYNAQTVQLMKKAGAIPLVTTNVSELGMWYESYNKIYGRTSNPYDTRRTSGGSSGGEGSLIGAAGSVFGIGSDVGGSIRIPSFFNGIFGHKPTPGVVSNFGIYPPSAERELVPFLSTGPMCRYATDLVPMMQVLAGKKASLLKLELPVKLNELKIYYVEDVGNHVLYSKVDKDLITAIHRVLQHFENAYKLKAKKLELKQLRYMYGMWAASISSCKAPSFCDELTEKKGKVNFKLELLQWCVGQSRFTFPAIILGLLEQVTITNSEHLLSMAKELSRELQALLGDDGILLFPPHPLCAPFHNEPLMKPLNFSYTALFNALGLPVTQCPLGLGSEGLPTGVQVVTSVLNDRVGMAVAVELEKVFGGWVSPSPII